MKTIRVILTKDDAEAVVTFQYRNTDWPVNIQWTGNRKAFRLADRCLVDCLSSLYSLEETVDFQAKQCGAAFRIEDLGGEVAMEWDRVVGDDE